MYTRQTIHYNNSCIFILFIHNSHLDVFERLYNAFCAFHGLCQLLRLVDRFALIRTPTDTNLIYACHHCGNILLGFIRKFFYSTILALILVDVIRIVGCDFI